MADAAVLDRLRAMIFGFRASDLVATAAELRLADHLAGGPRTCAELAEACAAHAPTLARVLPAMEAIGIIASTADGSYALTELGQPLRSDVPDSLYKVARLWGLEMFQLPWLHLPYSIRTGKTSLDHIYGMREFDYLATNPAAAEVFNDGMLASSIPTAQAALQAYDFGQFRTIMDVGGGIGALLAVILQAHPSLHGIVFDLPYCREGAVKHLSEVGLADRTQFVGGSFFESIPSTADAYLLKWIIHDWEDEKCIDILAKCRAAMAPDAKLLLFERVMPPGATPQGEATFGDVTMIVHTGGKERTEAEHQALLEAAGLRLNRVVPLQAAQSLIEAMPA